MSERSTRRDAAEAGAGPPAREEVRLRRVVTGVDFHESSWEAALWVMRHLAPDAEHDLLHVVDLPELPGPLRGLGTDREQLRLAARSGARRRLDELADLGGCPRVGTHLREGKAETAIVRLAEEVDADLIVVGEQGTRRGVGALLGSTAERVLFDSRLPVLLARKVRDEPPRRLLVAVDDSAASRRVLDWTRALVERFGASATVLNVVDRLLLVDELTGLPDAKSLQRSEGEAVSAMRAWLDAAVAAAALPAERVRTTVRMGDPSYEIISEAAREKADLVLVGSRGGDIARTPLVGRVVNKVVRSAPCSVLVARDPRGARPTPTGD